MFLGLGDLCTVAPTFSLGEPTCSSDLLDWDLGFNSGWAWTPSIIQMFMSSRECPILGAEGTIVYYMLLGDLTLAEACHALNCPPVFCLLAFKVPWYATSSSPCHNARLSGNTRCCCCPQPETPGFAVLILFQNVGFSVCVDEYL